MTENVTYIENVACPHCSTEDTYFESAVCPQCSSEIETVSVTQLTGAKSNSVVKFWTCPDCEAILGPTGR
jgi:uncharacterized protein with PIN domain